MKKLIDGILLMLLACSLASCRTDYDPMEDGHHRAKREKVKSVLKTVKMSLGGDYVTESEEPLLRADGDGKSFVGINVWRTKKDEANAQREVYAFGLYERLDNITIDVWTGYTYEFEASILIDGEEKLWNHDNKDEYGLPFKTSLSDLYSDNRNKFHYASDDEDVYANHQLPYLKEGTANVSLGDYLPNKIYRYPRVKRYYGTTTEPFDPAYLDEVKIDLDCKYFGLKIEVETLPAGYITANISSNTPIITNHDDLELMEFPKNLKLSLDEVYASKFEGVYSLYDLTKDSEEFKLNFTWNKPDGAMESFESTVTVKATTCKVVKLNIAGETDTKKGGNIILNLEEVDQLSEEEQSVTN